MSYVKRLCDVLVIIYFSMVLGPDHSSLGVLEEAVTNMTIESGPKALCISSLLCLPPLFLSPQSKHGNITYTLCARRCTSLQFVAYFTFPLPLLVQCSE